MQAARKHSDSHAIRYKLHRFPSSNMRTPNLIIVTSPHTIPKSTLFRVICQLLSILFVSLLEDHYQIVYENERKVQYGIFNSVNLDVLGQIYARMLQFETMFKTFPNASCRLILEQDYNYDPDLGSFRMEDVIGAPGYELWAAFTDEIVEEFRHDIEIPVSPCDLASNRKSRHESLAEDLCDNGDG